MLKNYLKVGWRNILRNKSYSITNITGLSVALVAFYLLYIYVDLETGYESFHKNKDRIFRITSEIRSTGLKTAMSAQPWGPALYANEPDVESFTRTSFIFERIPIDIGEEILFEDELLFVDPTFFDVFNHEVIAGNVQDFLTSPDQVVITEKMALKYFDTHDAIGKSLKVGFNGRFRTFVVSGIVQDPPRNSHLTFQMLFHKQVEFDTFPFDETNWRLHNGMTYILLKEGVSEELFESKLEGFFEKQAGRSFIERYDPSLQPISDIHLHSNLFGELGPNGSITYVKIASAVAFFILLIGCVNYVNLNTALSVKRAREVGARKVFGAERKYLIGQFISESILVALLSSALALAILNFTFPFFLQFTGKELEWTWWKVAIELSVLGILVGIFSGFYPALMMSGFKPIEVLKGRFQNSKRGLGLRRGLIVSQFTLSVILFIAAGMIYLQIQFIQDKDLGFESEGVLSITGPNVEQMNQRFDVLSNQLKNNPEILEVTLASGYPGQSGHARRYKPEGFAGTDEELPSLHTLYTSFNYIETLGFEVIEGRSFDQGIASDSTAYVVNEAAVAAFGYNDPIGKILKTNIATGREAEQGRIIGVVKDFHFESMHKAIEPMIICIDPNFLNHFLVKFQTNDRNKLVQNIEKQWIKEFSDQAFSPEYVKEEYAQLHEEDFQLQKIVSASSILAIFISCLGLLGLATFLAQQKVKEIGIRKVLGASRRTILLLLNKEFLIPILLSIGIGAPLSYILLEQWLQGFAYRTEFNFWLIPVSAILVSLVTFLTVSYNSIKVSSMNPVNSLRQE